MKECPYNKENYFKIHNVVDKNIYMDEWIEWLNRRENPLIFKIVKR